MKIMAISKDEKRFLKQIYYNNQELIMKICEAVSDELDSVEREALHVLSECIKNKSIRWSYNGETMTSEALVHCIIREQLQKGQSIETMSKFKMHSDPLVVTEERSKEDGYTKQEFNGLVYYVRTCCDLKDVLTLIKALNVDATRLAD